MEARYSQIWHPTSLWPGPLKLWKRGPKKCWLTKRRAKSKPVSLLFRAFILCLPIARHQTIASVLIEVKGE